MKLLVFFLLLPSICIAASEPAISILDSRVSRDMVLVEVECHGLQYVKEVKRSELVQRIEELHVWIVNKCMVDEEK